jgi:hypothetical protein
MNAPLGLTDEGERSHGAVGAGRLSAAPHNEEMQLTKPDGLLVGGRGAHVQRRRAIVFESGFAADLRCSADPWWSRLRGSRQRVKEMFVRRATASAR